MSTYSGIELCTCVKKKKKRMGGVFGAIKEERALQAEGQMQRQRKERRGQFR